MADVMLAGTKLTASAIVFSGAGHFFGFFPMHDAANDLTIEVFDGTDDTGRELYPATIYDKDRTALDKVVLPKGIPFSTGLYFKLTTNGTCEVTPLYKPNQFEKS